MRNGCDRHALGSRDPETGRGSARSPPFLIGHILLRDSLCGPGDAVAALPNIALVAPKYMCCPAPFQAARRSLMQVTPVPETHPRLHQILCARVTKAFPQSLTKLLLFTQALLLPQSSVSGETVMIRPMRATSFRLFILTLSGFIAASCSGGAEVEPAPGPTATPPAESIAQIVTHCDSGQGNSHHTQANIYPHPYSNAYSFAYAYGNAHPCTYIHPSPLSPEITASETHQCSCGEAPGGHAVRWQQRVGGQHL